MLSIVIPARNEQFLQRTIDGILSSAVGDIEILVGLDGYWPIPAITDHPKVTLVHFTTKAGMRPMVNALVGIANGDMIMKCDAHCLFAHGFDTALSVSCEKDWIAVPRQYSLDDEKWERRLDKPPADHWFISNPRHNLKAYRWLDRKTDALLDETMVFQGSCWMMHKDHYYNIEADCIDGKMGSEGLELALRTWLSGGKVVVNKTTWFAHLHKGKKYGRGYMTSRHVLENAHRDSLARWMGGTWPKAKHDIKWLIDKFSPVPTWEHHKW